GLGDYLRLGRGEEMSGGRAKKALLADAVEALIAAMYFDGGLDVARGFIESCVVGSAGRLEDGSDSAVTDYKSELQGMAQALKLTPARYITVAEEGPAHSKTFTVEVRVGAGTACPARARSNYSAGQRAG